jgi:PST family polysaccharide transporter
MIKKILKHKTLLESFASLYLLKITNILIPLVTLPYLVRVLGVEKFGAISFAQVFANLFVILVDFGFMLSIVKLLSQHSHNKDKVSEIFSNVVILKLLLIIISFLIYLFVVTTFAKFNNDINLFLFMFGIVIGQGLFPDWFFQGMQKMRYIAILNFVVKILFLVLILTTIKNKSDYLNYPILLSFGYIAILPFAYYTIFKNFNITFFIPKVTKLWEYLKYSSHFFYSRIGAKVYSSAGLLIVGAISSELVVGYYAIADKLRGAITSLYFPISQALYPYISKEKNLNLYKKIFIVITLLNTIALSLLFIFAPEILEFIFNTSSNLSVYLIRVFAIVMLFDVPSILLGYPLLGAFGYSNYVNYSLVVTAFLYIVLAMCAFFANILSVKLVAILYFVTIFFEFLLRVYGVYKYKIFKGNR